MPENIIHCPQCQRQLRVPEEMVGRLVKCPTCSTQFTVSASGQPQPTAAPVPVEEPPAPRRREPEYDDPRYEDRRPRRREPAYDYDRDDREAAAALVKPPAICLLVTACLGLMLSLFRLASGTYMLATGMKGPQPEPDVPEIFKQAMRFMTPEVDLIVGSLFTIVNLLILFGAIQMLRLRSFALAMTATIVAMLNLNCGCCLLGIPFGIWALIVLARQDVKSAFE